MTPDGRKVVAIDFDGVIHDYRTWLGPDKFSGPVQGAAEAVAELRSKNYFLILNTTRLVTPALILWLDTHGFVFDALNYNPYDNEPHRSPSKILADIYIDDRAINFSGDWKQTLHDVSNHEVWYKSSHISASDTSCDHCGLHSSYWSVYPICPRVS